jgi:predicted Ser/Thr protein kinase
VPSRSEDEFAETAAATPSADVGQTATAAKSAPHSPDEPRTLTSLGRLRLERVLGSGGMGVVHAAFDPDLERRVAVKLLHASSSDARARLLREARAMAKLSHPNVITVFDVGTADGVDFVTMELIDGVTLKDWFSTAKPTWREIVRAFIAAGRGLAAAHDAGLVHRDFKPANVLRSNAGKIVVTDFGLSRATEGDVDPLAATGAISGPATRTQTGAVLGTPAYMAPEQWTGANVGPASDQFAFCVALWEALAGGRPYRGDTLDEIKTGVLAGPEKLPSEALPRPVRAIVLRGLATDPERRWPSMHALLDALERRLARRRRMISLAAALAVGTAGTVGLLVTRHGGVVGGGDTCTPALDPDVVWSAARAGAVAKHDPESAKLLAADVETWRRVRVGACNAPTAVRSTQLACLDGVMARIDVAARAAATDPPGVEGTSSLLVDPELCKRGPHLVTAIDPPLASALVQLRLARNQIRKLPPIELPTEPCARAITLRARLATIDPGRTEFTELPAMMDNLKEAEALAERCSDDVLRAIVLVGVAHSSVPKDDRALVAVAAVPQDDLVAEGDLIRGRAARAGDPAAAITAYEHAIDGFTRRSRPYGRLRAVLELADVLLARGSSADVQRAVDLLAKWRPTAPADDAPALDFRSARARWRLGDVAGGDALAASLPYIPSLIGPIPVPPPTEVHGTVVDEAGKPVGNAEVVASIELDSDSTSGAAAVQLSRPARTRTAADGTFTLSNARGLVVATAGPLRSLFASVAPQVKLVVHPTSRVAGRVSLGPLDPTRVRVTLSADPSDVLYDAIAPVQADGTFSIDGVVRGKATIVAREYDIDIGDEPQHINVTGDLKDLALTAQVARPIHVIGRNAGVTPPDMTMVFLFPGKLPEPHPTLSTLIPKVRPIARVSALSQRGPGMPAVVRSRLQADDFYAKFPARRSGPLFACTMGASNEIFRVLRTFEAISKAFASAELGCADIAPTDDVVILEVPPVRRPKLAP